MTVGPHLSGASSGNQGMSYRNYDGDYVGATVGINSFIPY